MTTSAITSSITSSKKRTSTTNQTLSLRHSSEDDDDDDNDTISPRSFRNQISCIFPSPSSNSSTSRPTLSQQRKNEKDRTIRGGRKKNNNYEAAAVVVNDDNDDRFQIDDDDDGHDNGNQPEVDDNLQQTNGSPSKAQATKAKRRRRQRRKRKGDHDDHDQDTSSCTCCGCCRCCQHFHLCQIFYLLINDRSNLKIALLRLLPSMLVMKAFWLSVASIYICDLANIVQLHFVNNDNSFLDQPKQHLGIVNVRSFGLFSYSKNPLPERTNNRNNPYYYNQQQEEETTLDFLNNTVTTSTSMTESESFWNETSEALETLGEDIEDFVQEELGTCHSLQENVHFFFPLDHPFHIARVCGVSTILLGLISVTIIWIHTCQSVSKRTWYYTQFVVLVCCLLEGMTLMIFHTNICSGQPYELASLTLAGQHDLNLKASADMSSNSGDVSTTTEPNEPPSSLQIQCQCELAGGSEAVIVATLFWFITFISMKCVPSNLEYTWAMEYSAAHLASEEDDDLQFHHEEYELAASGSNFRKGGTMTKRHHHLYQVDEGNEDQGDDDDDDRSTGSENSFNYDNDDDNNHQQQPTKRYLKIV